MRENPNAMTVTGVMPPNGDRWIKIQHGRTSTFYPLRDFIDRPLGLYQRLGLSGITVVGARRRQLETAISDVVDYPAGMLATQPGWCGEAYVTPEGKVMGSPKIQVDVAFDPIPSTRAAGGSLDGWRDAIAPLSGQALPTFMLMLAFVPPLLRLARQPSNFGIEIVGPPGCGKTTMQRVVATAFGSGSRDSPHCQCFNWQATAKGLEVEMSRRQDQLYLLDEAASFYAEASPSNRANAIKAIIFALSGGREKITDNNHHPRTFRFWMLSSSNTPVANNLSGLSPDVKNALLSRFITLAVPPSPTGIVTKIPDGYKTSGDFIQALERHTEANHGYALPAFIDYLIGHLRDGPDDILGLIDRKMRQFRRLVNVDGNNGAELRVANVFALAYAAGYLARRSGVLPQNLHCRDSAVACYYLHRGEASYDRRSTKAIIRGLMELKGKVNLDKNADHRCSVRTHSRAAVFLRTNRNKTREMMIPRAQFDVLVPDHEAVLNALRAHKLLKQEGTRVTVKRQIKRGALAERVVCISLDELSRTH